MKQYVHRRQAYQSQLESMPGGINSQSALLTPLMSKCVFPKRGETHSVFLILIPDLRVSGSRQI
jgi:hypothetical protein